MLETRRPALCCCLTPPGAELLMLGAHTNPSQAVSSSALWPALQETLLKSCCCFSMGLAEMQAALPSQDWALGEGLEVMIDANNRSTAKFKSLQVSRQRCAS